MNKILLALAACALSTAALAQPMRPGPPDRPYVQERPNSMRVVPRPHREARRKVWVPAHREHGRYVRGHYVYR